MYFNMISIINTSNMYIQSNSKSSKHFILDLNLKQVKNIFILFIGFVDKSVHRLGKVVVIYIMNNLFICMMNLFPWLYILISYKHESKTVIRPSTHRLANKYIINSISIILNFGNYITDKDYVSMFKCYVL